MTEIKSISVSPEFSSLAKEHRISWSEAARVGMSILLGDLGVQPYDNKINLFRKMQSFQKMFEETNEKLLKYENEEAIEGSVVEATDKNEVQ